MNPEQLDTLRAFRAEVAAKLRSHRAGATYRLDVGNANAVDNKNPHRKGYDMALTDVLTMLDAWIGETQ